VTATKAFMTVGDPGPRNARTDPDTGLRYYSWQGVEYPSVTSVRNLAGMPHKLANWRTTQVIERAMTQYPTLGTMLATTTPEATATWLRRAMNEKRDLAAGLGKRVHDAAATGMTLDKAPADIAPFLIQYERFLSFTKVEVLLVERQVWNLTVGYAGTFDFIGRFPQTGEHWMIDLKTGSGLYPEHALQVEAYSRAEFVGNDDVRDDDATDLLHSITGRGILHLSATGWEFVAVPPSDETWIAFRALLKFASWVDKNPTMDTLVGKSVKGVL
jgi:hypothetical protein